MKILYRLLLVYLIFLLAAPLPLTAEDDCGNCHEEVRVKSSSSRIVHQPFLTGKCAQCHVLGETVSAPAKRSSLVTEKQQLEEVRWFKSISSREREHWLRLPADALAGPLYLKATDGHMRSPLQKIDLPDRNSLPQKVDDQQAPQQLNLRVTDVRRGISTSATLQWETDEFTESVIYYGAGNLRSVKSDQLLARQHAKILLGLDADKIYQYQVVSRDLFGNETRSPVQELSTEKSYWLEDASYNADGVFNREIELAWDLYQYQNDFLVVVHANRPVSLSLGTENRTTDETRAERPVVATANFTHPILKSSYETNISVCRTCHREVREEYSHPINVKASSGMVIPTEYALLPDGKMTCMTCHDNHASNHDYRLRKSHKAELCRGCHRKY